MLGEKNIELKVYVKIVPKVILDKIFTVIDLLRLLGILGSKSVFAQHCL